MNDVDLLTAYTLILIIFIGIMFFIIMKCIKNSENNILDNLNNLHFRKDKTKE